MGQTWCVRWSFSAIASIAWFVTQVTIANAPEAKRVDRIWKIVVDFPVPGSP